MKETGRRANAGPRRLLPGTSLSPGTLRWTRNTSMMERMIGLEPTCTWMATTGPAFGPHPQNGRAGRIRTDGLVHPKHARYQLRYSSMNGRGGGSRTLKE